MRWQPLLLCLAFVLPAGCGDSEGTGPVLPTIAAIRITPVFSPLPMGYRVRLLATPVDEAGEPVGTRVTWTSSNTDVATALANGTVRGVSPGEVRITAEADGVEASTSVTVVDESDPIAGPDLQWTTEEVGIEGDGVVPVLHAVWGSSPEDVFAVGGEWWEGWWPVTGAIVHNGGSDWKSMTVPVHAEDLLDVWGASASDVFAVGALGTILHYDGTTWAEMASGTDRNLSAVWGSSGEDVFAAGARNVVLHYDGAAWTTAWLGAGPNALVDIWGSSGTDVFAVGSGAILHYDGDAWTQTVHAGLTLMGVWGTSSTNVFAVGDSGVILHYDGTGWSAVPTPPVEGLLGIQGTDEDDMFAVGSADILHYDGTIWRPVQNPTSDGLLSFWVAPEDLFLAGWGSTIAHGKR